MAGGKGRAPDDRGASRHYLSPAMPDKNQRLPMQGLIERIILWSRYILIVFYVGLGAGLAIFAGKFFLNLWSMGKALPTATDNDMLLAVLVLIDKSLVAGLVVMVML